MSDRTLLKRKKKVAQLCDLLGVSVRERLKTERRYHGQEAEVNSGVIISSIIICIRIPDTKLSRFYCYLKLLSKVPIFFSLPAVKYGRKFARAAKTNLT